MNPVLSTMTVTLVVLLAACAQAPGAPAAQTAALDCSAIEAQIHSANAAQRAAAQQQHDAWKAVVPFAVLARYGTGAAAANESQQRIEDLQRHAALRGCAIPAH